MKVLFFAEGATLAHVARPWLLAEALSKEGCEVVFACPPAACWITRGSTIEVVPLRTQPPELFARRLQRGQPLYDLATLEAYLRADLALLDAHRPDLVVGDFRLSLSVGARLAKLPYITLCDAYWAPETAFEPVVPVLPFTRFTPIPLAQAIFRLAAPLAFRAHAAPMEALRRAHGLPGFDGDLRRSYTDADLRLFANPQELFPSTRTHEGARFIGPMAWSPDMPLPDDFPDEPDLVFVSMGSSGSVEVLAHLFAALTRLRLPAVVATAGRPIPPIPSGSGIRSYDFVPARAAIAHSRMVVCNGGSPVTNLAYLAGKPLLGIPANMDQLMNMRALVRAGVGQSIRADRAAPRALEQALKTPPAAPEPTVADDPATLGQRLLALRRWS
jgi:UDP:flavonoid glycosyltransferase YjiC (YdhE family)